MISNYFFDKTNYSWRNALLWGNFIEHCKKARTENWGDRIVHILIASIEFLPIISQISSIFEKFLADRPRQYQISLSSELPKIIESQRTNKTYARAKLLPLEEGNRNFPTPLASLAQKVKFFSKNAIFYPYNAEGIRDYGWGCAWRAIQTCLSAYQVNISLETLFHLCGPLKNLKLIYRDKYPLEEELFSSKLFAPYDLLSGWAEPFIGHMVMHFYNIPSDLEIVNGIPNNCNTPQSVFHHPPIEFNAFRERLDCHFKNKDAAPIMIDDGHVAVNIIGIEREGLNTTLWIADPHIGEGVNPLIMSEKSPAGLYKITLNETGKQISCSLTDEDKHQIPNLFIAKRYLKMNFNTKSWMVLFPLTK